MHMFPKKTVLTAQCRTIFTEGTYVFQNRKIKLEVYFVIYFPCFPFFLSPNIKQIFLLKSIKIKQNAPTSAKTPHNSLNLNGRWKLLFTLKPVCMYKSRTLLIILQTIKYCLIFNSFLF